MTVSSNGIEPASSAERIRAALADADRHRRVQAASRAFWWQAPVVMGVCVGIAAVSRGRGWPVVVPLGGVAAGALVLAALFYFARVGRPVSDSIAAGIDDAAGFEGELRSAGWFASRETRDSWAACHLDRAAVRLRAADWTASYPALPAGRAKLLTAALALYMAALLLMPRVPVTTSASSAAGEAGSAKANEARSAEGLLPEVQKQLEALLAAAETGSPVPAGIAATASELRALLSRLDVLRDAGKLKDLARAMASPGGRSTEPFKELKTIAERAQNAARMPGLTPEEREALQRVADDMAEAATASERPGDKAAEAVSSATARKSDAAPGNEPGEVDEPSIQEVSDAEAGGGAGVIMMGDDDKAAGKAAPGVGLGGGSDTRTDGGRLADLEAALKRETVEASRDADGQNVETEARRKTEHGQATVTYAGSAAGAFDRGRAVAPPAVPESRRTAVQTYFIRKQ